MRIPVRALVLVLAGTTLSAQSGPPADAFYDAIRHDDRARVAALVRAHGTAVTDTQGQTPLMMAASIGTADAMRALLAAGADARAASPAGVTALHLAVDDIEKTRLLLDAGADVNAVSQIGRTPLLVAASINGATAVARLLIDRGAKIDVTDAVGATPLTAAALVDNTTLAELLLARGARVATEGGSGPLAMPMFGAATNGNARLVRALLARGVDPNATTADQGNMVKHGRTMFARISPLHLAVNSLNLETVQVLLDAGAKVDPLDVRNMTPLMFAIATDRPNVAIISRLLKAGAQTSVRDIDGASALDWARRFNDPAVLKALNIAPTAQRSTRAPAAAARPELAASHQSIRGAVERAMLPLREVSSAFFAKGGCIACHAQPLTQLAVGLASARGWTPPSTEPDMTTLAATLNANAPVMMQFREAGGMPDGFLYMMLPMAAERRPAGRSTDAMVRYLVAKQRATGEWQGIGGTRAPMQDGDINRTALAIRALTAYTPPAQAALYRDRVRRAAGWLQKQTPASTNDVSMLLLGLHWADAQPAARQARLAELKALQRADGGWGQTPHLPSDAYATGVALYALRISGVAAVDPAVRRGAAFLVNVQQKDGTWHVANRAMKLQPYFDSGFPYAHDQWISHAGSAWAAAALTLATPEDADRTARR
jgi:ankyrin repeat protein